MFQWFATSRSEAFARELAADVMRELGASTDKRDARFAAKAEKVLLRADRRVRQFTVSEPMNFYKKAKLGNAFLWALKDAGCAPDYAQELTEWLSLRL